MNKPSWAGDKIFPLLPRPSFLGQGAGLDQGSAAMVATDDVAGFELVERPAHGGQRAAEARGERVQVGVFVLADEGLDEVGALLVGHRTGRAARRVNRAR